MLPCTRLATFNFLAKFLPKMLLLLAVLAACAAALDADDDIGVTHHWVFQTSAQTPCLFGCGTQLFCRRRSS